jgi:hypothetical protein
MAHYMRTPDNDAPQDLMDLKEQMCTAEKCKAVKWHNTCGKGKTVWRGCPYIAEMVLMGADKFHDGWTGVQG